MPLGIDPQMPGTPLEEKKKKKTGIDGEVPCFVKDHGKRCLRLRSRLFHKRGSYGIWFTSLSHTSRRSGTSHVWFAGTFQSHQDCGMREITQNAFVFVGMDLVF